MVTIADANGQQKSARLRVIIAENHCQLAFLSQVD